MHYNLYLSDLKNLTMLPIHYSTKECEESLRDGSQICNNKIPIIVSTHESVVPLTIFTIARSDIWRIWSLKVNSVLVLGEYAPWKIQGRQENVSFSHESAFLTAATLPCLQTYFENMQMGRIRHIFSDGRIKGIIWQQY